MKKILFILVLVLAGCTSSSAATISINKDTVPSLYTVIGEKKITGTSKSVKDGVHTVELTYKADTISLDELYEYSESLRNDGYLITQASQENQERIIWQLGKNASVEDNIILINFIYVKPSKVIIEYISGEGTITPN